MKAKIDKREQLFGESKTSFEAAKKEETGGFSFGPPNVTQAPRAWTEGFDYEEERLKRQRVKEN